ncbi:MAG: Flp family type IVb pilin [Acidimicrobiales bacterium]
MESAEVTEISPLPGHGRRLRRRQERGANLVEYALILALIALACIGGVAQFGQAIKNSDMKSVSASI